MAKHTSGRGYHGRTGFGNKFGHVFKEGAASAVVLYPAAKLVWALDSAAKNFLPVAWPDYARTPVVGLALSGVAAALPAGYWTEKIGELTLAAALVQSVQQFGATTPGTPGTIDATVNKAFAPIANLGMKGYVERLRGYVETRRMGGYVQQMGAPAAALPAGVTRYNAPAPVHPNAQPARRLRGFQAEHSPA